MAAPLDQITDQHIRKLAEARFETNSILPRPDTVGWVRADIEKTKETRNVLKSYLKRSKDAPTTESNATSGKPR